MTETMRRSWDAFAIGRRNTDERLPLETVGHVTHVVQGLEILRDGKIRPQLVSDGSRLDTRRVQVVFVSPYDWVKNGQGYRFGNVGFVLDWPKLIEDKRFYWLGAKKFSRPDPRPRILVTDREHPKYKPYVADMADGPWWFAEYKDRHFWNGKFCIEFLVEGDIPLRHVKRIQFVRGHSSQCSLGTPCLDRGHDRQSAAARMLAGACHLGALKAARRLWKTEEDEPRASLRYSWQQLWWWLIDSDQEWRGSIRSSSEQARPLARAVTGAYYHRNRADCDQLLSLFAGRASAIRACAAVIEQDLGLEHGTLERD